MINKNEKRQEIYLDSLEGYVPYRGLVLIKPVSKEGTVTKAGILIGFNPDTKYVEEEGSHIADMTITEGDVIALPLHHYTEGYTIPCEIEVGDRVFFSYFASLHGTDVWVRKELYRLIRYDGLVAAKRGNEVIILNGYVLLEAIEPKEKKEGIWSPAQVDRTRGVVRFMGQKRVYDHPKLTDEIEIEIGDTVLLRKDCPVVPMERQKYLATFEGGDKMYRRVKRGDIVAVINSFETIE
jgi:co-chaperonin GroES (HSP10)